MIRQQIIAWSTLLIMAAAAQAATVTSTFEDVGLAANSEDHDAGGGENGFFISGGSSFNNKIEPTFGSWSGFAISSITDATPSGFANEFGVVTGGGAGGSQTFAIAETFAYPTANIFRPDDSFVNLALGTDPLSVEVVNSAYTYTSMSVGDSFVGPPFAADDFLRLDIVGYDSLNGTGVEIGTVPFYLANFLNGNSAYVNAWTLVDLSSLAGAKSLRFGLESSRFNDSGMTTPAYAGIDNLTLSVVPEPSGLALTAVAGTLSIVWRRRRARGAASPALTS